MMKKKEGDSSLFSMWDSWCLGVLEVCQDFPQIHTVEVKHWWLALQALYFTSKSRDANKGDQHNTPEHPNLLPGNLAMGTWPRAWEGRRAGKKVVVNEKCVLMLLPQQWDPMDLLSSVY
jgi:hypothetical protein